MNRLSRTVSTDWSRLAISRRRTRQEKREFPQQIPGIFADARTLPIRLLKGQRLTRFVAASALLLVVFCGAACDTLPTMPSASAQSVRPEHHNIPATFIGHSEGPVVYLCETQPRSYVLPNATVLVERDHYLQYELCPRTPIQ